MLARINRAAAAAARNSGARLLAAASPQRLVAATRWHSEYTADGAESGAGAEAEGTPASGSCPPEVDVVVVGGGVIGCAALYRLARAGLRALLIERHQITAGAVLCCALVVLLLLLLLYAYDKR